MSDEQRLRNIQTDPRPTSELIQLALSQDEEEHEYYDTLEVLHFRGTHEVLDAARELCQSLIPHERLVGVDILGKLGESARMLREARMALPDANTNSCAFDHCADIIQQLSDVIGDAREFPEEIVPVLLHMQAEEECENVIESLTHALGHYTKYSHEVIKALVQAADHEKENIKHAAAMSLGGVDDPVAIETVIRLTTDTSDLVRDWATFSLAKLTIEDSPEICNALAARLDDEDDDVFGEAICGLARCGDHRVISALLSGRILQTADDYRYQALVSAAVNIADPQLLPLLLKEKEEWGEDDGSPEYQELLTAIAHCMPEII